MNATFSSIKHSALTLGCFALLTVGLVALTWFFSKTKIDHARKQYEQQVLQQIIPANQHDNDLLNTHITLAPNPKLLGTTQPTTAYFAFKEGQLIAIILPAIAPDGYSGRIYMLVGIYKNGTIAGVRITEHKETPGLGDKIDKKVSNWIDSFIGKSLRHHNKSGWAVKKDGGQFDQFTGATITPRAVVKAVHHALEYFHQHQKVLFRALNHVATP